MRSLFVCVLALTGSLVLSGADKVAVVPDGASASGPFSPSSQTRAYFAPMYERVRAVRR